MCATLPCGPDRTRYGINGNSAEESLVRPIDLADKQAKRWALSGGMRASVHKGIEMVLLGLSTGYMPAYQNFLI